MRLFIAIPLPQKVKDYLYDLEKKINSNYAKVRWVHKKNLHLTLKFIGHINEDKIEMLKKNLNSINFESFKIKLSSLGAFPNMNNPKVIWVGFEPEDNIIKLQQCIDEELLTLFPSSEQKLITHATLGRVKVIKKKKEFLNLLKNIEIEDLEFEVNSFSLIKSELTRNGPKYWTIENFVSN